MIGRIAAILALVLTTAPVSAGKLCDDPPKFARAEFLQGKFFTLRQSFQDKNTNTKPAQIQWTERNDTVSDSYLVDAALGFFECTRQRVASSRDEFSTLRTFKPIVSYARSTVTDKESNTLKAGFAYDLLLSPPPPTSVEDENQIPQRGMEHYFSSAIAFKDDRVTTGDGLQVSLSYSPLGGFLKSSRPFRKWGLGSSFWQPAFALQYESGDGNDMTDSGSVIRFKPSVLLTLYPFERTLDRRVSLSGSYSMWVNSNRSGPYELYSDNQYLRTVAINFNLVFAPPQGGKEAEIATVALALENLNGENPESGKPDQDYSQIALKVYF